MKVTLVVIFGLAPEPPGMRDFAESMKAKYPGLTVRYFTHEDTVEKPELLDGSALLFWAHSFGVWAAIQTIQAIASHNIARRIVLVAMDGKPKGFVNWWNPFYAFTVPSIVSYALFYWAGFGRPAKNASNVKLSIGHSDFPSNETVQSGMEMLLVQEMAA